MSDAARMVAGGWSTEGLPAHMVASLPHTCEVEVQQLRRVNVGGQEKIALDTPPQVHTVQLERDGKPLTKADVRTWSRGEAEGWKPTPIKVEPPAFEGIIDVEAEEVANGAP